MQRLWIVPVVGLAASCAGETGSRDARDSCAPGGPQIDIHVEAPSCAEGRDGRIELRAIAGVTPLNARWDDDGTASLLREGLAPGTYLVTVSDAMGCAASHAIDVAAPPALELEAELTEPRCAESEDGAIALTARGGDGDHHFAWGDGAQGPARVALAGGSYEVTLRDGQGCELDARYELPSPEPVVLSVSTQEESCPGSLDGSAHASASGGRGELRFEWRHGAQGASAEGLAPGSYAVTAQDAVGCEASAELAIASAPAIELDWEVQDVSCAGAEDGEIQVTATGGRGALSVAWDDGAMGARREGLRAGEYRLRVSDENQCERDVTVRVAEPEPLSVTVAATDLRCVDSADGALSAVAAGGNGDYRYVWAHGPDAAEIAELESGRYEVTVSDARGCTASASAEVAAPAPIRVVPRVTHVSCAGAGDGAIALDVEGGNGDYRYAWSHGGDTAVVEGLSGGAYAVAVLDARGCDASAQAVVEEASPIVIEATLQHQRCADQTDAGIDVEVSGGEGGYAFSWFHGPTGEALGEVAPGSYTLTVHDLAGCSASGTWVLQAASPIEVTLESQDAACPDSPSGEIVVAASGGEAPLRLLWDDGAEGAQRQRLLPGEYAVTVIDALGCEQRAFARVSAPPELALAIAARNISCAGAGDGRLDVTASGGTPPVSYLWTPNDETGASLFGLAPGSYSVVAQDALGCRASANAVLVEAPPIEVQATVAAPLCAGDASGELTLEVSGGEPPYEVRWSDGAEGTLRPQLAAGSYTATVTDAAGCTFETQQDLSEPAAIELELVATDASCADSQDGGLQISALGGAGDYRYQWSTGETTAQLTDVGAGRYAVTVTDANDCTADAESDVNAPPALHSVVTVTPISCAGAADGGVHVEVTGGAPPYDYAWDAVEAEGPSAADLGPGEYSVVATDANGCSLQGAAIVAEPLPLSLDVEVTPPSCGESDGALTLTATGGAGAPHSYEAVRVEDGARFAGSALAGLAAGRYQLSVVDAAGCEAVAEVALSGTADVAVTETLSAPSCVGAIDGAISLALAGGAPPFEVAWEDGGEGLSREGLGAGEYAVTIHDADGCAAERRITLDAPKDCAHCDFTVNAQIPAFFGNYQNLSDLVSDLEGNGRPGDGGPPNFAAGLSGPTTVCLAPGSYHERIALGEILGAGPGRQLRLRGDPAAPELYEVGGLSERQPSIELSGAHIALDGLTILAPEASSAALQLSGAASNIDVVDCVLEGSAQSITTVRIDVSDEVEQLSFRRLRGQGLRRAFDVDHNFGGRIRGLLIRGVTLRVSSVLLFADAPFTGVIEDCVIDSGSSAVSLVQHEGVEFRYNHFTYRNSAVSESVSATGALVAVGNTLRGDSTSNVGFVLMGTGPYELIDNDIHGQRRDEAGSEISGVGGFQFSGLRPQAGTVAMGNRVVLEAERHGELQAISMNRDVGSQYWEGNTFIVSGGRRVYGVRAAFGHADIDFVGNVFEIHADDAEETVHAYQANTCTGDRRFYGNTIRVSGVGSNVEAISGRCSAPSEMVFHNNVIYTSVLDSNVSRPRGIYLFGRPEISFLHNTVFMRSANPASTAVAFGGSGQGLTLRNNIFVAENTAAPAAVLVADLSSVGSLQLGHNLYWSSHPSVPFQARIGQDEVADFADWATQTGDGGEVIGAPGFVAPPDDLRVDASGPGVDAGDPNTGVTVDRDGNPRDSAPDIGAYER